MKKRDDLIKDKQEAPEGGLSRRRFMGAAALAGVAGATGLGSTIMTRESFAAAAKEAKKAADKAAADAKKAAKKAVIAKSSILMDIKPWDAEYDLEDLAKQLKSIEKDGLLWGAHKLVPVAFGVKKLQIIMVIEDDKISGEDIEDMITGDFEEYVQSMDIVAWNKI